MPKHALKLILEWSKQHQKELLENWELCKLRCAPHKITPLE